MSVPPELRVTDRDRSSMRWIVGQQTCRDCRGWGEIGHGDENRHCYACDGEGFLMSMVLPRGASVRLGRMLAEALTMAGAW